MKDLHVVVLTPNEFNYYESFEKAVKQSVSISDYDDGIQKVIVKVRKDVIANFIKDHEAFEEIPPDEIKIVWWE